MEKLCVVQLGNGEHQIHWSLEEFGTYSSKSILKSLFTRTNKVDTTLRITYGSIKALRKLKSSGGLWSIEA